MKQVLKVFLQIRPSPPARRSAVERCGQPLWRDGFTVAENISDEDAAASFRAIVHGISSTMMEANKEAATWLIEGSEPGPAAIGVIANAGARA